MSLRNDALSTERDIESKRQQILMMGQESSERTRNMVRAVEESKAMGRDTLTELDRQTETMKRIDGSLDQIDETMDYTDRTIKGMESIWGSIGNFFSRKKAPAAPSKKTKADKEYEAAEAQVRQAEKQLERDIRAKNARDSRSKSLPPSADLLGGRAPKNEFEEAVSAQWQRQDEDLDTIFGGLGELKAMAADMNKELDNQSGLVDKVSGRMDGLDDRIRNQNKRVGKMLK
jgi:methyl-accepting chemotaxis protein